MFDGNGNGHLKMLLIYGKQSQLSSVQRLINRFIHLIKL